MHAAVFDTDVLIRFSKGDAKARAALKSIDRKYVSQVTWIEFLVGIETHERAQWEVFFEENFDVIVCDGNISPYVVDLRRTLRLKLPDATIYGTAKYLKVPLITFNTKDFDGKAGDVYVPE